MPTIDVTEQTFRRLQALAVPFEDSPESVVVRLLDAYTGNGAEKKPARPDPKPVGTRARRGERTPAEAFFDPLIEVLKNAGGELPTQEAVDRVGKLVASEMSDVDLEPLQSGELRWRNTCRWARKRLVEQGVIDPFSSHGVWRLKK